MEIGGKGWELYEVLEKSLRSRSNVRDLQPEKWSSIHLGNRASWHSSAGVGTYKMGVGSWDVGGATWADPGTWWDNMDTSHQLPVCLYCMACE